MNFKTSLLAAAVIAATGFVGAAQAATDSTTFDVKIQIVNTCNVSTDTNGADDMDFGTGVLSSATNVDAQSEIRLTCTPNAAYNIGLAAASGAVGARAMQPQTSGNTDTVPYQLYRDAGRTLTWGDTIGTDTLSNVGNGSQQTQPVYGRVASANFTADNYSDTVTVTVTY